MTTITKKSNLTKEESCPIFLRKTYHMIDTCDSSIACWSEDGETFVVKNTEVFEKKIIPQFFKHNKFSSFVRQLNFYGFRKIKYADTIKIDAKLEAETANFWRFRHEKFQRGKPEQLVEIKRMSGQQHQQQLAQQQQQQQQQQQNQQRQPNNNNNKSTDAVKQEDSGALRTEVTILKKRIEDMTKNIDNLTSLVSKVTLKEEEEQEEQNNLAKIKEEELEPNVEVGNKRKKIESSSSLMDDIRPDGVVSSNMMIDEDLSFGAPSAYQQPMISQQQIAPPRTTSSGAESQVSDELFVDHLFTEFANEGGMDVLLPLDDPSELEVPTSNGDVNNNKNNNNRPDPKLMSKLSDALALLPREIQEMIIDRLIKSITSTDGLSKNVEALTALSEAASKISSNVVEENRDEIPPSPKLEGKQQEPHQQHKKQQQDVPLPLAAATLAAMLSQYSTSVKDKSCVQSVKDKNCVQKSIPVVPIHA